MTVICALPSCNRPLPPRAIEQLDRFCSTDCARQAYGVDPDGTIRQVDRRCAGCGCGMDETTAGCEVCRKRLAYRRAAAA